VSSKRRKGYPSETHVKRGLRFVRGGEVELVEKLGRNDPCPCGSGKRFQKMLPAIGAVSMDANGTTIGVTEGKALPMGDAMGQITAVVFDVGRVLVQWDLRHLFAKLVADSEELDWFLANVITPEWHFQHDAGRPLAEMVAERQAEYPAYAAHLDAYQARFNETIPGPVPGSFEIVEELAARGVPLFAITNFGAEFWAGFRPTQPIFDHFRDIIVSGVEKLVKPDAAIYQLALSRFGLAPGEAIFIDDSLPNVAAAQENGFAGHHFTDAAALRKELFELGLLTSMPTPEYGSGYL
jgi:2-haloacid dehalogenase